MQHPTITLIIRYPNHTLNLASQDHLRNKVIVQCASCKQTEVVTDHIRSYNCKFCDFLNKVTFTKGKNCKTQGCNGVAKAYLLPTGLMTTQCQQCGRIDLLNY